MITLDDFLQFKPKPENKMPKIAEQKKSKKTSVTRREWTYMDLPLEINSSQKAKKWIEEIRGSLNEKQKVLLDLIENGTKPRFVKKGNKKVQISEGLEPYSPYLLYVLWRGVNGRA